MATNKDEKKKYLTKVLELMNQHATVTNGRRVAISEAFSYYYGRGKSTEYNNLLTLFETDESKGNTPFAWTNFDSISTKINVLIGEFIQRGFDINIECNNDDAIRRKNIYEAKMRFMAEMQKFNKQMANISGIPYGVSNKIPMTEETLEEHMEEYRDLYELLMNTAIQDKVKEYNYVDDRREMFLDMLVGNEATVKVEVVNGKTTYRRVNSLRVISDNSATGDYQRDRTFVIEAHYVPIGQAMDRWDISEATMTEMMQRAIDGKGQGWHGGHSNGMTVFEPFISMPNNNYGSTPYGKVLVIEAQWLDVKNMTEKDVYDSKGGNHLHYYMGKDPKNRDRLTKKEKADGRNKLTTKKYEVAKMCTLIGVDEVVEYGEKLFQDRNYEDPSRCALDYITVIPAYNQFDSKSLVMRIQSLQDFRNYTLTLLQHELTASMPDVLEIDKAEIDVDTYGSGKEAVDRVLHLAKAHRVVVKNGAKNKFSVANNNQGQAFRNVPQATSRKMVDLLNIAQFFDQEIDKISGVNANRMGIVGERQSGVSNEQSLMQSSMVTQLYFSAFEGFESRLFEKMSKQIAYLWTKHPERYQTYAAQLGVELPDDIEADIQSYKCYVTPPPATKSELKEVALGSVMQGNMTYPDYLELIMLSSRNLKAGIRKYLKMSRKREAEMMDIRRQELAQQQKAQEAMDARILERDLAKIQEQNKGKIEVANINQDGVKTASYLSTQAKDRATDAQRAANMRDASDQ